MPTEPDNGVLGRVRGEEISAAMQQLPRAAPGAPEQSQAETDSAYLGLVRITFKLSVHKRGKQLNWFWIAIHAEQLPATGPEV